MPNSVSLSFPEIWSKKLQKNYDNNAVMANLVNKSLSGELANYGDTVHLNKYGDISITDYTAGTDFAVQTVSLTDATLILNQAKAFQFVIDTLEKAQSIHDLGNGYLKRASIAAALTVDSHLLALYSSTDAGNIVGSDSAAIELTRDNVHDWFTYMDLLLDEGNIPMDNRVAVITPAVQRLINQFLVDRPTEKGDSAVMGAYKGKFGNFECYVTTNMTAVSDVFNLMFFHKDDFIHHVMRIPPGRIETYKPEFQFGTGYKGLFFYGSKVFHTTAGAVLKSTR